MLCTQKLTTTNPLIHPLSRPPTHSSDEKLTVARQVWPPLVLSAGRDNMALTAPSTSATAADMCTVPAYTAKPTKYFTPAGPRFRLLI
ncbi:hypothetical protein E2C01_067899 [Portunus trituberculatus]|uniref:Uncharacterized protein n=1 Tax=Portunus trituberculatus TaxID=210409 RepID=A0A5B7HUV6_PORTR|nr:hypothetical protein [Portunus trituberculatus]